MVWVLLCTATVENNRENSEKNFRWLHFSLYTGL